MNKLHSARKIRSWRGGRGVGRGKIVLNFGEKKEQARKPT